MKLSKRLQAVADMVPDGSRIADIGTDHAYLPIYLVSERNIPYAIAGDINEGPLAIAKEHISQYGLSDKIECRLSDGINEIRDDEADTIVIAGMGGDLIERMISDRFPCYVLCPHTHPEKVRAKLEKCGFVICDEDMILEDGKFYQIIMAKLRKSMSDEEANVDVPASLSERELNFGPMLIRNNNEVLKQFLMKEKKKFKDIEQKKEYLRLIEVTEYEMQ